MQPHTRLATAAVLACSVATGAYLLAPTAVTPTPTGRIARAEEFPPPIIIDPPIIVTQCTPLAFPTPTLTPTATPFVKGGPGNLPPIWVPRPIGSGPGQPLALNPATLCVNAEGTPVPYRVKVISGNARIVKRTTLPGAACETYFEWYGEQGHETLDMCQVGPGTPTPTPDEFDPEVWIWFNGSGTSDVEIDCGCDGITDTITISPPPFDP